MSRHIPNNHPVITAEKFDLFTEHGVGSGCAMGKDDQRRTFLSHNPIMNVSFGKLNLFMLHYLFFQFSDKVGFSTNYLRALNSLLRPPGHDLAQPVHILWDHDQHQPKRHQTHRPGAQRDNLHGIL